MSDKLAINKIRTDGGTQPRKGLDADTVEQYTQAVKAKVKFPPVIVYHDGAVYWLADGFHRLQAHRNAQKRVILADVRQGNLREAILHSAGANATHGLRRSNDDKQRAVMCLLDDPEWAEWSDRAIAKRCNVSHTFVSKLRPDSGNVATMNRKFIHHKTGETSTMKLSKQATQIIDGWLRNHFDTEDPSRLASHARYSQKGQSLTALCQYLELNGINSAKTAVVAVLTELAAQYQEQVPTMQTVSVDNVPKSQLKQALILAHVSGQISVKSRIALQNHIGQTILTQSNKAPQDDYLLIKYLWGALSELLA